MSTEESATLNNAAPADAGDHSLSSRYWNSFIFCSVLCVAIQVYSHWSTQKSTTSNTINASTAFSSKFQSFQRNYLTVFLLAMFSDWLQGPYVYELYVSYGFSQLEIAELFVCGFGSSMIVGTFVGGLADKLGRKSMCILYSVFYICACFTKLVPEYWTLMLGRFLSGIATSLLFSVFESWMVCEHHKQGFDGALLGETFAYQTLGNGIVAVLAGLVANYAAEGFGYVAPFVVAIAPLGVIAFIVSSTWTENYGDQSKSSFNSFQRGFDLIRRDSRIAALGMAQSCFEGAMYTFVFMWTPALKSAAETQLEQSQSASETKSETTSDFLGLIFAVFMISCMVGSSFFKIFQTKYLYQIPLVLHTVAFLAMGIIAYDIDNKERVYAMFLIFEMTVGLFYPAYGTIKADKIPEDVRSSVMNMFRIPLNAFVVILLLKIQALPSQTVFEICAGAHAISFVCYAYFYLNGGMTMSSDNKHYESDDGEKNDNYDKKTMLLGRTSSEYDMHMRESGDAV